VATRKQFTDILEVISTKVIIISSDNSTLCISTGSTGLVLLKQML